MMKKLPFVTSAVNIHGIRKCSAWLGRRVSAALAVRYDSVLLLLVLLHAILIVNVYAHKNKSEGKATVR